MKRYIIIRWKFLVFFFFAFFSPVRWWNIKTNLEIGQLPEDFSTNITLVTDLSILPDERISQSLVANDLPPSFGLPEIYCNLGVALRSRRGFGREAVWGGGHARWWRASSRGKRWQCSRDWGGHGCGRHSGIWIPVARRGMIDICAFIVGGPEVGRPVGCEVLIVLVFAGWWKNKVFFGTG